MFLVWSWLTSVFVPFIRIPFFSMLVLNAGVSVVSSTRSTGMPKSSSIWAFRFKSSLKLSFGAE